MTKVILCGALGRMGKSILETAEEDPEIEIVAGVEHPDCIKHTDLGEATGIPSYKNKILTSRLEEVISEGDVVVEFSGNPQAAVGHTRLASAAGKAMVIGTTGFSEEEKRIIEDLSKEIPIVLSPNMSVGVNLLFKIVELVTDVLKDKGFDVEITEIHHKFKKDSPSGTAVKLLDIIKDKLGIQEDNVKYGRKGISQRQKDEIGVFALRGGDVVGDHTVYFLGMGERLEITHRATSRKTFARGTLEAAKWIKNRGAGLYNMFDVLGL